MNPRHAIVEELARLGASVHTCARNEADLQKCLQRWRSLNLPVSGSVCDVSSRAQREKLIEAVSSLFQGSLNILINNAAICTAKQALDYTAEDYSSILSINFESVFHLSQLAHPLLKASGAGSVVLLSSVAGLVGLPSTSLYGAAKGAINQLTRNFALEWAKDGIRVNCIAPGPILTPMLESVKLVLKVKLDQSLERQSFWEALQNWNETCRKIRNNTGIRLVMLMGRSMLQCTEQVKIFFATIPQDESKGEVMKLSAKSP